MLEFKLGCYIPIAFSQSVSLDNEAGASVDPPLLLPPFDWC